MAGLRRQAGFTLLEVMVALTITGFALGGLFAVIAGSKGLAFRSEAVMSRSMAIRNLINYSQLNDEQGEVDLEFVTLDYELDLDKELEAPERKTRESFYGLKSYDLLDEDGELILLGTYWVKYDLPQL